MFEPHLALQADREEESDVEHSQQKETQKSPKLVAKYICEFVNDLCVVVIRRACSVAPTCKERGGGGGGGGVL